MANTTPSLNSVQQGAENTVRRAGPWIVKLARAGYAAKGFVYIVIGVLALEAAVTGGGKTTNSQGALATVVHQPFGHFLLGIVAVGLLGYALWRFVEAGLDAENKGDDAKGMATRAGYVLSGIAYSVLAYTAFHLSMGGQGNNNNKSTQDWTARILSLPLGQELVGLIGLIVIGVGIAQIVKGYKADFNKELELNEIPGAYQKWAIMSGRLGYIARGVVFGILGGFIVEAAMNSNPKEAKGIGSALDLLSNQPYGPMIMGIVAAGLIAYGVFMFVEMRYRRLTV